MNTESKKVLVVEDEQSIVQIIKKYLERAGLTTFSAPDGKAGLELALKEKPDLILLDLRLPVMNGIMFLEELRVDSWGKDAVVVALTNDPTEEAIIVTRSLGVKDYIVKSNWSLDEALNRALVFIDRKLA